MAGTNQQPTCPNQQTEGPIGVDPVDGNFVRTPADRFRRGSGVRSIGFPIVKGLDGIWPRRNAAAIRQTSIQMILGTVPGERLMLPEFGSRLNSLLFDPNDEQLQAQVIEETKAALGRWDPFLQVINVLVEQQDDQLKIFIDFIDLRDEKQETRRVIFRVRRL